MGDPASSKELLTGVEIGVEIGVKIGEIVEGNS